jgi:hypothetical protein
MISRSAPKWGSAKTRIISFDILPLSVHPCRLVAHLVAQLVACVHAHVRCRLGRSRGWLTTPLPAIRPLLDLFRTTIHINAAKNHVLIEKTQKLKNRHLSIPLALNLIFCGEIMLAQFIAHLAGQTFGDSATEVHAIWRSMLKRKLRRLLCLSLRR